MTILPDDALKAPQREVQRLLGRCLLRLQQYEQLIKAIVAHHDISGPVHSVEAEIASRVATTARKTLGTLVGELLGSYLVNDEINNPAMATTDSAEGDSSISMKMGLRLSDAEFAQIESDLKELVLLRNNLVHHFIEQHDLWSLDGCRGAHDALVADCNRIGQHYEQLREWAEDMDHARRRLVEFYESDDGKEWMVNGIAPDGTVHWPAAGIVSALREAAGELAVDGWAPVDEASRWIAERRPEQTPKKYGCSSWRQVVHESLLFDLKYFEVDGVCAAWYRKKKSAPRIQTEILFERVYSVAPTR